MIDPNSALMKMMLLVADNYHTCLWMLAAYGCYRALRAVMRDWNACGYRTRRQLW